MTEKKKTAPIDFLIEHREKIVPALYPGRGFIQRAWDDLETTLPELKQEMRFETFKKHCPCILAFQRELGKLGKDQ